MTEREVPPRLPTSGQIIGALVTRLGIRHPVLQSRTARRYFSAAPERLVKDSTRAEIIEAIAEVLTGSGFIASQQTKEDNYDAAPALASMLQWHADNWDLLRSFLRRRIMRVQPGNLPKIWEAYVRLAVIDLALRVAAHLHLAGASPAALNLLDSWSVSGRGAYLNRKRQQPGISLEHLAVAVGVTDNTVDAWMYQGTRPADERITRLSEALSGGIEGTNAVSIATELRALYWVSDVAALLSEHIAVDAVDEVIGRLHRYAEATYGIIDDQFPVEDRTEALTSLTDLGVGARLSEPLLTALIEQEPDEEWREDLKSTGMDWIRRVLSVNVRLHLDEVDDIIQKTEGRLLEDWDVSNPDAYAHCRRSLEIRMDGKLWEALAEVEIAARLDPLDPANHCTLGSVKTGIGIGRGNTALVGEGLDSLWLAVALDPNWILPWTEIGLTLLHTDRLAEAVAHLRGVKPECGPLDSGYYCALGQEQWKLGRLADALTAFEAALELDPEETATLLTASEIASLTGDDDKRRRYSRLAQHFGADEGTFRIWDQLREFGNINQDNSGTGDHNRKLAILDAIIRLSPDDDYALLSRAIAHLADGEDDLALADLDALLMSHPDHAAAHVARGTLNG